MEIIADLIFGIITFLTANFYSLKDINFFPSFIYGITAVLFIIYNIVPSLKKIKTRRLKICYDGCRLLRTFLVSLGPSLTYNILGALGKLSLPGISENNSLWGWNFFIAFLIEAVIFWAGMLRIYLASKQLGIKYRGIGLLCGFIPVINIIVLIKMINVTALEVKVENELIIRDKKRKGQNICATKYPVLLVHGVFFRDFKYFNYWGRIPEELQKNGAKIYYADNQSALSVEESAKEIIKKIEEIIKKENCDKVNIIAHSKGGLDSRYAISKLGADKYAASLVTINTPHRGCEFADYLLDKAGEGFKNKVAEKYNAALKVLGDTSPDFIKAVTDLTSENCRKMNEEILDVPGVYYESVGSRLNKVLHAQFPLNLSYAFVKYFDGPNDGLVGENSFKWGENFTFLTLPGKRGISHGDMIDLNRENIKGFDVREFYVQMLNRLKQKGF